MQMVLWNLRSASLRSGKRSERMTNEVSPAFLGGFHHAVNVVVGEDGGLVVGAFHFLCREEGDVFVEFEFPEQELKFLFVFVFGKFLADV